MTRKIETRLGRDAAPVAVVVEINDGDLAALVKSLGGEQQVLDLAIDAFDVRIQAAVRSHLGQKADRERETAPTHSTPQVAANAALASIRSGDSRKKLSPLARMARALGLDDDASPAEVKKKMELLGVNL